MDAYLSHHGIRGMRWGIRRYQNEDGTLTPAGVKRYNDAYDKYKAAVGDKQKKQQMTAHAGGGKRDVKSIEKNGVKLDDRDLDKYGIRVSENGTDIIKKGSVMQRVSRESETLDSKRKYVSIEDADNDLYVNSGLFGTEVTKYEAIKDLNVASAGNVANHILKKYGSESLQSTIIDNKDTYLKGMEIYSELFADNPTSRGLSRKDAKIVSEFSDWAGVQDLKARDLIWEKMQTNRKSILNEFEKKGYDAIVDGEDFYYNYANYPLILLNPEKSVKKVKSK